MSVQQKPKTIYVTKLKAGQKVKTPKGSFDVKNDETSIYISQDLTLKAGDKLYLNPVESYYNGLASKGTIDEDKAQSLIASAKEYNQSHVVSVYRKK